VFAIFTKRYVCVCCAIIVIATCQVLLAFKIKVPIEKYGNLWNFIDSPTISNVLLHLLCLNGYRGLGVACWPLVPKFAGSNPAEAVGFLRAKKSSTRLPSEGK